MFFVPKKFYRISTGETFWSDNTTYGVIRVSIDMGKVIVRAKLKNPSLDSKEISNHINISKNTFSRIGINLQKNQIKSDEIGEYSKKNQERTEKPK